MMSRPLNLLPVPQGFPDSFLGAWSIDARVENRVENRREFREKKFKSPDDLTDGRG
jgi:hypothetical protein